MTKRQKENTMAKRLTIQWLKDRHYNDQTKKGQKNKQ